MHICICVNVAFNLVCNDSWTAMCIHITILRAFSCPFHLSRGHLGGVKTNPPPRGFLFGGLSLFTSGPLLSGVFAELSLAFVRKIT